jgi:hypothetical protein
VVLGFLRDGGGRPDQSVDIVELGAGGGRFAFLFLRALETLLGPWPWRDLPPIRYVMTDVTEGALAFWRAHEALAPFVRAGRLDFARFDAERDDTLRTERGRRTIGPRTPVSRLVVVASYVLSGLRQDAFVIRGGRLHEYLADAARAPRGAADGGAPCWRVGPRVTAPYPEEDFNAILRAYTRPGRAGRAVFPVSALRCLERLAALACEDTLVLAADRGTADAAEALARPADLELARHGSRSFPVDFHAIGAWVARRGGEILHPARAPRHLHVAALLLGAQAAGWRQTRRAYDDAIGGGGPDALYTLRRGLTAVADRLGAPELLALIRLCGHDPRTMAECLRPLWPHLADADARLRREIREAALAAWAHYYHLGEAYDLAFNLGLLLYQAHAWADARALFEASLRLAGEDGATWWNLGLCQVALGKPDAAAASFRRSRALAPALSPAGLVLVKAATGSRPSSAGRDSGARRRHRPGPRR